MSIPYALKSSQDLFGKLKRDSAALADRVDGDRIFNFTVTAWSLKDWIVYASNSQDERIEIWNKIPEQNKRYLQVCGDIANGLKHFRLSKSGEAKQIFDRIEIVGSAVLGRAVLGQMLLGSTGSTSITTKGGDSFSIEVFRSNIVQIYADLLELPT